MPARTQALGLAARYGGAVAAVLAATGVRLLLMPVLGFSAPHVLFYLVVVAVSTLAGRGPAVVSAVLGGLVSVFLFIEPRYTLDIATPTDAVWLFFYFLVCGSIIYAIDAHKGAAMLAQRRLAELEAEQQLRAAAEREREAERRWATQTLASIGDGVITTSASGKITFMNRVACDLSGWKPEEAIGQPVEKVFHIVNEETSEPVDGPVGRVLREGVVVALANHTALIRKDGQHIPIDDSGAPIHNDTGAVTGAVLVFRDYTQRRLGEQANARLAAIVEFSQEAIISKSLEGVILTWNPSAEKLFGYTAAEVVGRSMAVLLPPGKEHEESGIIETMRSGRAIRQLETVRRRKDGVEVQVSLSISPIYNTAGEIIGISHIARDITAEKELYAQLLQAQKLESVGVLAGGVAHDFNNLLTGIIGAASLLAESLPEGMDSTLAQQIVSSGERAAHLTQQLLAYSGKGRFVVELIEISSAVREIVELLRVSIPRTTEVTLELAPGLPPVEADVAQFQQIVMNLVINAAEALGGAVGKVTVSTTSRYIAQPEIAGTPEFHDLEPGEYAVLRVTDSGSGMDEAMLARIFDPFFTTKFTGRGLGLAAVHGIVRGHRGAIRVQSAVGRGTVFEIYLPAAARAVRSAVAGIEAGKPAVLVVDDEEVVRETARLALERAGYRVITAEDGQAGIDIFEQHAESISLVLLDLTMPVLSGRATLDRLRALRPDVPVLLCSGYNEIDAMRQVNDGAVAGFVKKPFTSASLRAKVEAVLARSARAGADG